VRRIVQTIIGGTQSLVRFALSLLDTCTLLCRETSGLLQVHRVSIVWLLQSVGG